MNAIEKHELEQVRYQVENITKALEVLAKHLNVIALRHSERSLLERELKEICDSTGLIGTKLKEIKKRDEAGG